MTNYISKDDSPFMTTDELAALLRAPASTIRYWRHIGCGPKGFRVGKRVLYRTADVETWLEDRLQERAVPR